MDIKKKSIKELLDRLAQLLKNSKRAFPLRDLIKEVKKREKTN